MGTRKDLRDRFRVRMGFPEDTATGNDRFNAALNSALRHLWSDLPDVLLTEEFRFVTEPPIDGLVLTHFRDNTGLTDGLVFVVDPSSDGALTLRARNSEECRGRWLEIDNGDDTYSYRRIQDVFQKDYTYQTGSGTNLWEGTSHITVDKPWPSLAAHYSTLTARILTLDYPYPADVQKITHLIYSPSKSGASRVIPMLRGDHNRWRMSEGWRATGSPQSWARGDYFQLSAPRYTPKVEQWPEPPSTPEGGVVATSNVWGYLEGVEHGKGSASTVQPKYGPAGTFSYKVVHVWGRRPSSQGDHALLNEGDRAPFYISSCSPASEQIRVKWGDAAIKVVTPNIDVSHGYNPDTTKPSYTKYGVEKWIFRARHETEDWKPSGAHTGPWVSDWPADGVYYLWDIVSGYETETADRGQLDPPDRRFSLENWNGHQSIRFDRLPTSRDDVLMEVVKRPPQLHHDSDAPRIPDECVDALFALCASYLVGDRDGSMERKHYYLSEFEDHKRRLIRQTGIETAVMPSFGDGLGLAEYEMWESAGETVKES